MEEQRERLSRLILEMRGDQSLRQFARCLKCSQVAVTSWEHGDSFPDLPSLEKIANFKGWTLYELLAYLRDDDLHQCKSVDDWITYAMDWDREDRIKAASALLSAH
jgi:transcriptional regulator with XRE-family HTH domain